MDKNDAYQRFLYPKSNHKNTPKTLSKSEKEIYGLVKQGKSDAEIAKIRNIKELSVRSSRYYIRCKGWDV